jgi:hypothetical protein
MTSYSHCPADIRAAIDQYENDVKTGAIRPWNPDKRDEYTDKRAFQDMWLTFHLACKLSPAHLGYMLVWAE